MKGLALLGLIAATASAFENEYRQECTELMTPGFTMYFSNSMGLDFTSETSADFVQVINLFAAQGCQNKLGSLTLRGDATIGAPGSATVTNPVDGALDPSTLDINWSAKTLNPTSQQSKAIFESLCSSSSTSYTFTIGEENSIDNGCENFGIPPADTCQTFHTAIQMTEDKALLYLGQSTGFTSCSPDQRTQEMNPSRYEYYFEETESTQPEDQSALVAFWNGLSSKGTLSWKTAYSLCGQEGVTCSSGKVTRLWLTTEAKGALATEIGALTSMTQLMLQFYSVTGTIPTELGKVTKLEVLDLSNNDLSGTIPTELGKLVNLKRMDFSSNELSGTIPTQLGQIAGLNFLDLSYTKLGGTIPTELGKLTKVQEMYLSNNKFTGGVPTEFGLLKELQYLYANSNPLGGTLPSELGQLSKLEGLRISYCSVTGTLPTELGTMMGIGEMQLDNNLLSGTIPTELGNMPSIVSIVLERNKLTGAVPTELARLDMLKYLYLSSNRLSGVIPSVFGVMLELNDLDLSSNSLSGEIPSQLGNMKKLNSLYLHSNLLTGTLPKELGQMPSLRSLYLEDNHLYGTIPTLSLLNAGYSSLRLDGTNHFCPLVDYSTWASYTDFPENNATCQACAAPFELCPQGSTCLGGVNETFRCSNCPQQTLYLGASWPNSPPGTVASGTCASGYSGNPTRLCREDGTWQAAVQNQCTLIQCGAEIVDFASWPPTNASSTSTGTCLFGYTGSPTRACSAAGKWLAIQSPCAPPADQEPLPVVQITLRLTNLDYAWFYSSEQSAQAFLSSLITYFAQLLGVPTSSIVVVSVTEGSVVVKFDVRTADPEASKAKAEDFIESPDLSFLSLLPDEAKEDPSQGVGLDKASSGVQVSMADPTEAPKKKSNAGAIAGGVIGGLLGLALIGAVAFVVARKIRANSSENHELSKVSSVSQ